MKNYSRQQLVKDLTAGVIVAIIALPLSIALALASGVDLEKGLYTAIDATGIHSLETIVKICKKNGSTLILSHVNEQPMEVFKKSGMYNEIGEENFCEHIDASLARAEEILKK